MIIEEYGPHCVTIAAGRCTYRFFGRGVWRVKVISRWFPVSAVRVPRAVLKTAAEHASKPRRERIS